MRKSKRVGAFLFLQGKIGRGPDGAVVQGVNKQAAAALERIAEALVEEGLGLEDICRARVYLRDAHDWTNGVRSVVIAVLGDDGPPVTVIGVSRFVEESALIEIEVDVVAAAFTTPS